MSALTPFYITGYEKGLQTNKKPFLLPDQAWSTLNNMYTWRERVKKREGNYLLGRLQRDLTGQALGNTVAATLTYTFADVLTTLGLRATEPKAEIKPGTFNISIAAPDAATFTDNGDGTFSVTGVGVAAGSYINYATGKVVINISAAVGGAAITAAFSYFPALAGMGIWQRESNTVNVEQTLWFDQKYAYVYVGANLAFTEFLPGAAVTWSGNDSQFFWAYNYQAGAATRLLYVTNFKQTDPMRYTDGATWTTFAPLVTASNTLWQARIIIPYYNRLLLLNTWEGATGSGAGAATNYFTRCRFSQLGDPTAVDAFRSDQFGKGGFLDAPTDEQITGATFVKNTLIVDFEYSTWQLRYVGEYGMPFIWERVSSDYGSGSTFSGVLFDNYRLKVGDEAITRSNAVEVKRIDLDVPDQVFEVQNNQVNNGALRVWGVRDFQKELVYWNYADANDQSVPGTNLTFPNKVLLYNYRNETWSIFRDNITAFGYFQIQNAITWDSTTITWDNEDVTWDDPNNDVGFNSIGALNQQGFGFVYKTITQDDPSLAITGVGLSGGNYLQLTIPNHNLMSGEIIYLTGLLFQKNSDHTPASTDLNSKIFSVYKVVDANTIQLTHWDTTTKSYVIVGTNTGNYSFTPDLSANTYIGGGEVSLFPRPNLISKDVNLFQQKGIQTKLSRLDFLIEPQPYTTYVTCNLLLNSSPLYSANILLQPTNFIIRTNTNSIPTQGSDYQWFSFWQTLAAQYFRIQLTYSDELMNTLTTHQSDLVLYAINAWTRPGGRLAQ